MHLNLKQSTYQKLLERANQKDLPLASYINQILEQQITQQGVKHGHNGYPKHRKQPR